MTEADPRKACIYVVVPAAQGSAVLWRDAVKAGAVRVGERLALARGIQPAHTEVVLADDGFTGVARAVAPLRERDFCVVYFAGGFTVAGQHCGQISDDLLLVDGHVQSLYGLMAMLGRAPCHTVLILDIEQQKPLDNAAQYGCSETDVEPSCALLASIMSGFTWLGAPPEPANRVQFVEAMERTLAEQRDSGATFESWWTRLHETQERLVRRCSATGSLAKTRISA